MVFMLARAFFVWWYGQGWKGIVASLGNRLISVSEAFSLSQILASIFAPWRRIVTYPGASLAERFRAWGDNLFSRLIGFIIRLFVLIAALIWMLIVLLATLVEIVIWPLLPPSVPVLLIIGLI